MNTKKILISSLAVALVAAIASIIIANLKTEPVADPAQSSPPAASPAPVVVESAPPAEMPAAETMPAAQPQTAVAPAITKTQKNTAQAMPLAQAGQQNQSIQDPDAREALSLVGADPDAEAYWIDAINNPDLSDKEREDLMEDLNEDGLSDPQNPSPEDLQLIVNRIRMIEEIVPYADDFMLEHLGEAYKDLNNMLDGQPVR
jgi:hypothetical protein